MNARLTSGAGVLLLTTLAAASVWLLIDAGRQPESNGDDRGPAWHFDGARLSATGRDGAVLYRVESPRIEHVPADDSAVLESPVVEWLQGDSPPLSIHAATGRADRGAARLRLEGGVQIEDDSLGASFTFNTEWLEIDARSRTASTDAEVTVQTPNGIMQGIGLLADLDGGTIAIRSSVSATYGR